MNTSGGWNGSGEDWLHGDEDLIDEHDYPALEQWEIDEALADVRAKELREQEIELDFDLLLESVEQMDAIRKGGHRLATETEIENSLSLRHSITQPVLDYLKGEEL